MAYFWISQNGSTETLELDDRVYEITIDGNKRAFDVVDFASADGGHVRGFGNFKPKQIDIVEREKRDSGDAHFWNSRRDDLIQWFTKPAYKTLYFNIIDGENTSTYRTPIITADIGGLKFKNFAVPDNTQISLIAYKGVFENTGATTGNLTITSANEHSTTLTNNGTVECAPTFTFTPTANEDSFAVKIAEDFGFLLEGTFVAGVAISYDMENGELRIGGAMVSLSQYLSKGSHFKIPKGSNTLYVTCSGAGAFSYSFYDRKI